VADLVLENIGAPDWVMQTILLLMALGFPGANWIVRSPLFLLSRWLPFLERIGY